MLLTELSIAGGAVAIVAVRPRSWSSAITAAGLGAVDVVLVGTASVRPALSAAAPMLAVLTAALVLAAVAVRAGLPLVVAQALARAAGARATVLFALVCLSTAALTALVTLDAAVVLLA